MRSLFTNLDPVIVWASPERAPFVRAVLGELEYPIAGAGCEQATRSAQVADVLGTDAVTDLRAAVSALERGTVLFASPGPFGASASDAELVRQARVRGVKFVALEPVPGSVLDVAGAGWIRIDAGGRAIDAVAQRPLIRLSGAVRNAADVLSQFGPVRTLAVESWSSATEAPLASLLWSAVDAAVWLQGEPVSVEAKHVGGQAGHGPTSLRSLSGDVIAVLTHDAGRLTNILCSDMGGRWNRSVTLVGDAGRLRVYDDGFEWVDAKGEKADELRTRRRGESASFAVAEAADQLRRVIEGEENRGPDPADLLACVEAILLSARTGQVESPESIRRHAGLRQ